MYIVGLTGGIGSGKSTVAQVFQNLGIEIIDADQLSRDVVLPGSDALEKISEHFGSSVINKDGTLNRAFLREHVFNNTKEKIWLEELLHPLIREAFLRRVQQVSSTYCIYMAPLLIENNLTKTVDRVLVVDVPEQIQLERASARDDSEKNAIQKIIATQVSREQRLSMADDIIDNSGNTENLREKVQALHQHYCEYAKKKLDLKRN